MGSCCRGCGELNCAELRSCSGWDLPMERQERLGFQVVRLRYAFAITGDGYFGDDGFLDACLVSSELFFNNTCNHIAEYQQRRRHASCRSLHTLGKLREDGVWEYAGVVERPDQPVDFRSGRFVIYEVMSALYARSPPK
ncbi:hypothetical protein F441_21044 [Phytophthora nicotianae CJ01A1]|uniref:Uncharacterized protein n=1 Tax=Phytophthora nicotianae CJ01A1 TaxID=1317063 RepID=W2VVL9_PHYNI|nr:hypothetical protein F441_21044 [Phytophthora nicotianae CJ01A1]